MNIKPPSTDLMIKLALGVAVLGVAYYGFSKVSGIVKGAIDFIPDAVDGVLTGNNYATNNARTDAYKDKGLLGTMGAVTDNATGGYLSRFGEWLGGKTYDLLNLETPPPAPTTVGHRNAYWKS